MINAETGSFIIGIDMVPMLTITGRVGTAYNIQYTSELGTTNIWNYLDTVIATEQPVFYCDKTAIGHSTRFYRLEEIITTSQILSSSLSTSSPNSGLVIIDDNSNTDDIRIYEINLKSSGTNNNVVIKNVAVFLENGDTTSSELSNMINRVKINFGNEEYSKIFNSSTSVFENINYTIDSGDTVSMSIRVDLNGQSGNYENGSSFFVSKVVVYYIDAYGNLGSTTIDSDGGKMCLETSGPDIDFISSSLTSSEGMGIFRINTRIKALGGDIYIPRNADTSGINIGFIYEVVDGSNTTISNNYSSNVSSSANIVNDCYEIMDGDTYSFTLTVYVSTTQQMFARLKLKSINCKIGSLSEPVRSITYGIDDTFKTSLLFITP